METAFISKIIRIGSSNGIVLPIEILNAYKWERGDYVVFGFAPGNVLFVKQLSDGDIRAMKPNMDILA